MFNSMKAILIGLSAAISLLGCAVSGTYPSQWPEIGQKKLVGKCPDVSGKYNNHGVTGPADAKQLTLTQILGLADGDAVAVVQSPELITVSVWNSGRRSGEVSFVSGETSIGWDMSRPRSFICPVDILSGRTLLLSDLERGKQHFGGAYGLVYANWEGAPIQKAADGSLVVKFEKGTGALIGLLPAGKLERVWYRFESLE